MSNGIQEVDQEVLGTIKRHAGFGMAAGIAIAIAVGVLLIASGVSRLFLAFRLGSFGVGLLVLSWGCSRSSSVVTWCRAQEWRSRHSRSSSPCISLSMASSRSSERFGYDRSRDGVGACSAALPHSRSAS